MTEWQDIAGARTDGRPIAVTHLPFDGNNMPIAMVRWSKGKGSAYRWREAGGRPLRWAPTHFFDPETLPEPLE